MKLRLSVVIPTFRRNDLLLRCLKALLAQTLDGASYEIIVADDAGSHRTRRLIEEITAVNPLPLLRYLTVNGSRGPAAARNRGWRAADGEFIAFTDDDCIPSPHWLEEGLKAFGPRTAAVSGRILVPRRSPPTDHERETAGLEQAEFATANCFYRRVVLETSGGFDERFRRAWREDADLYFTLLETGQETLFAAAAAVLHPARPAPWGVSIAEQKKSMYNALLYKKHPALYRRKIQPLPPLHYYAAVGMLAASAVSFAGGWLFWSTATVTAWAYLSAWFCLKRLKETSRSLSHVTEMAFTSLLIPPLSVFWRLAGAVRFRVLFL